MTDATTPSADDIAFVRKLAESGANAPLNGGRFMAWWGFTVSVAYLAHHLALNGAIGGRYVFLVIWPGFVAVSVLGQIVLLMTMPARSGAGSAGNRAMRTVWTAAAGAICAFLIGAIAATTRGAPIGLFDMVVSLGFAVYACALVVSGVLAANRVTLYAGFGSILAVGVYTALLTSPDRYLVAAAGTALTVLLPGLLLLRAEPRA